MEVELENSAYHLMEGTLASYDDTLTKLLAPLTEDRESYPDPVDELLAKLLGYKDADTMARNWSEEDNNKLIMLGGPHGKTIYKAMLAKNGHK